MRICKNCGSGFEGSHRKFCGLECALQSQIEPSGDGCWEWRGGQTRNGYGFLYFQNATYVAHRVSYELHCGPIPDGMIVMHKCDNPPCCNPAHLMVGTKADNNADKVAKGRQPVGSKHGLSKLTEVDVQEIRWQRAGGMGVHALARAYGVSRTSIKCLCAHRTWRHVPAVKEI